MEDLIKAFVSFFRSYVDDRGRKVYMDKIAALLTEKPSRSLEVDYCHLNSMSPDLAKWLLEDPERVISAAEDALRLVLQEDFLQEEPGSYHVRFYNLPATLLPRNVGSAQINKFIQVEGVVSRISEIRPYVSRAVFVCRDCGHKMIRLQKPHAKFMAKPGKCEECGSKDIVLDREKSTFIDYQHLRIQDAPEKLKGGEMPRFIDAIVLDDLCETVVPGDRVIVTGVLRTIEEGNEKEPILKTVMIVNHITKMSRDIEDVELTEIDIQKIKEEAKKPDIKERIINSIAPSIYGMKEVKEGLALALFGGVEKPLPDGTRIRGETHILLIGDPGKAKSQLLRFLSNVAPRAVYASAEGASKVGLTAAAVKDEFTGGWIVEAGVMVLADRGLAIIDELDKMNDSDRKAIHTAMEQGIVTVNKAGISTTLNARATVIAAANPKHGRWNPMKSFAEQINLGPTLLSRFDLIFVLIDDPDEDEDRKLARHILNRDSKDFEAYREAYDPEFLRKYVAYARKYIHPKLSEEAKQILEEYFVKLRKRVKQLDDDGIRPIPITARQLEALIRLSEAHARLHLRDTVTAEDVEAAIRLMEYTLKQIAMDESGVLDVSIIEVGKSSSEINKIERIEWIIKQLDNGEGAPESAVINEAGVWKISEEEAKKILDRLKEEGRIYELRPGHYRLQEEM
nr:minichromosome maintenance protein MCM [Thermococcus sp. LS2]